MISPFQRSRVADFDERLMSLNHSIKQYANAMPRNANRHKTLPDDLKSLEMDECARTPIDHEQFQVVDLRPFFKPVPDLMHDNLKSMKPAVLFHPFLRRLIELPAVKDLGKSSWFGPAIAVN